MSKSRTYPGWPILLILLIFGGIVGSWIGDAMIKLWPALHVMGQNQSIGLPNFTLDLKVFSLTFGFILHINLFTILGFIIAYFIFKRL